MNIPFEQRGTYLLTGGGNTRAFFDKGLECTGMAKPVVTIDRSGHPPHKKDNPGPAWHSICQYFREKGLVVNDLETSIVNGGAENTLLSSDYMYVCGGSTRLLAKTWDHLGFTGPILERIRANRLVVAGGSAGAMVWFDQGYSDSSFMENPTNMNWRYITAHGIGSLPGFVTAHHSDIDTSETNKKGFDRGKGFRRYLNNHSGEWGQAFGLDTYGGMICVDGIATAVELLNPSQRQEHGYDQHTLNYYSANTTTPRRLEDGEQISLFGTK
ncbi:MAG: Type 1 glutamine amidotransferase-like domain-containing protein [Candidatus Saccharimonadales bacterium]